MNRGLSRLHDNDPQNKFRQASISPRSAQSSSFNPTPVLGSAYDQGYSKTNQMQTVSQPPRGGHSVRYLQSSMLFKHNGATAAPTEVKLSPKVHKKPFPGLSTGVASASSVAKYNSNQDSFVHVRPRNQQQGTRRSGQYPSSSAASVRSPSREVSASHQSAALRPPTTAATRTLPTRVRGSQVPSAPSSKFFRGTSATVRARRVSSPGTSASKPSRFSPAQNGRSRNEPSQRYRSSFFPVVEGAAKGSYKRTPGAAYPQTPAFGPRSFQEPTTQSFYQRPSHAAAPQNQNQWNNRPRQSGGSSLTGRVPTKILSIPQSFGGSPIRRLKKTAEPKVAGVQKPQQKQTEPSQQTAPYNPQGRGVPKRSRWVKVRVG